jgi:hypothetical protein
MSLIFATQLSAMATTVLAAFAIVTAWYARRAFLKQSQEVRAQAMMLQIQADQLAEDRKINAQQTRVLELQAQDLHESLKERKSNRQVAEREQADKVGYQMTAIPFPENTWDDDDSDEFAVLPGRRVHMAIVSNESRRPVENVVCRIGSTEPWTTHDELAVVVGRLASESGDRRDWEQHPLVDPVPRSSAMRIRPGERHGFVFEIAAQRVIDLVEAAARFTDDAGLHWQIDRDQHLKRLPDRDW